MSHNIDQKWFKDRIKDQSLSMRAVAERMSIDSGALSRALSGQRIMKPSEIDKIATILKVPREEAFDRAGRLEKIFKADKIDGRSEHSGRLERSAVDNHSGLGLMKEQAESESALETSTETTGFAESPQAEFDSSACNHPLFGILKGVIKIPPGVDLTEPAFPDWDEYLDRKYGKAVREDD